MPGVTQVIWFEPDPAPIGPIHFSLRHHPGVHPRARSTNGCYDTNQVSTERMKCATFRDGTQVPQGEGDDYVEENPFESQHNLSRNDDRNQGKRKDGYIWEHEQI